MRYCLAAAVCMWTASACRSQPVGVVPPAPPLAAGSASLRGVVMDPRYRPVRLALVRLVVADHSWTVAGQATTQASGTFVFSGITPGTFVLWVDAFGFDMSADTVHLAPEHADSLRVQLRPSGKPDPHDPF